MEEKQLAKYAVYKLGDKEKYQYLPTGKIKDVIFEKGMLAVKKVSFLRDGKYFVRVIEDDKNFGIGTRFSAEDIINRYYADDPLFSQSDEEDIESLRSYPADKVFVLTGDGELYFNIYNNYIEPNYGDIPDFQEPRDIVEGDLHWYLELHTGDAVSYEATLYDDKKYRGQECDFYTFVRVVEYEVDGVLKKTIVGRDEKSYEYHPVEQTTLDDIIDKAKALISHQKEFDGFAGVSPLYVFNTEDSACVFHDKKDKIVGNTVVTVAGSGDAILDLFLYGADKVITFDTNLLTRFEGELKFIAAKYLSFEEFQEFFGNLNEGIFRKIEPYLSGDCRKFWNELYEYSKLFYDKPIKDAEGGGLFYPTNFIFASNLTVHNPIGYFNEENYLRLQEKLKSKSLDDLSYYNCDLYDLPKVANLNEASYAYLSNIMDFIVSINENRIDKEKLEEFKIFVLEDLLPKLKEGADIDLFYIKAGWHIYVDDDVYLNVYPESEGFKMDCLSNGEDKVLSFQSDLLEKIGVNRK